MQYLAPLPNNSEMGRNTGSDRSLHQAEQWIQKCANEHGSRCWRRVDRDVLPKRLIDVGQFDGDPIRLVDTKEDKIEGDYMTLSHSWGQDKMFKLEQSNLGRFRNGISWHELPNTFREAVKVTRRFNIRYIWIDSLCIVQDTAELRHEAAKMHQTYRL